MNQDWILGGGMLLAQSCFGRRDDWESQQSFVDLATLFSTPLDNSGYSDSVFLNPMALALFEDPAWYQSNYTFYSKSTFSLGAGHYFVGGICLNRQENENNGGMVAGVGTEIPNRSK
ncbi:unnamed protein product [Cylindrotheca closterium]|uniref:Uncharacterized protein n=1 Tax=Cylindrotheca closterium TaxID=2856 RepID=A0AAD2CQP9_9STRA|nr:unnamed protein product [Cylindrotheca closterium]